MADEDDVTSNDENVGGEESYSEEDASGVQTEEDPNSESEEDIDTTIGRIEQMEDDEISPQEEGFMHGYSEALKPNRKNKKETDEVF